MKCEPYTINSCMAIKFNLRSGGCSSTSGCVSKDGCPPNVCPDFLIKRHDTRPSLKVAIEDCDGPMDFRGLVIEVNMWAFAKLKTNIDDSDDYFRLAGDIGFDQVMVGDVIIMDQIRMPEKMLVLGFDERNKLIKVQRGYLGTTATSWSKGDTMRIFRILNGPAYAEMSYDDVQNIDGTTDKDVLQGAYLVYEWKAADTCLPGCYWLEFKVLKMIDISWYLPGGYWTGEVHQYTDGFYYTGTTHTDSSVKLSHDQLVNKYFIPNTTWLGEIQLNKTGIPSNDDVPYNDNGVANLITPVFTDSELTPSDFGCILGEGVEWVRRFPTDGEGFLIKIGSSPTTE